VFHRYLDPATGGELTLSIAEPTAERSFFRERTDPVLALAWNRGAEQQVWVDSVALTLPANAVITLMVSQSWRFEHPQSIVLWRFNRSFYCIVDHDREVSCVGLLFYGAHGSMVLPLPDDDHRRLTTLLGVFDDEFRTTDTIQGEMLRVLLKRLIIILTRLARRIEFDHGVSESHLALIRQFNLAVENNYRRLHRVTDYAALLNKSPKTLANVFTTHEQLTPRQVIHARIVIEAKRMLIYTDQSAKQIANALGFDDPAAFSRFFKGETGSSPVGFRATKGGLVAG
jgi:AraC family transcriptional regulator, transcriptional activator of pobA